MKFIIILLTPAGLRFLRSDLGELLEPLALDHDYVVIGLCDIFGMQYSYSVGANDSISISEYQQYYISLYANDKAAAMQFLLNYPPTIRDFIKAGTPVTVNA